uniref:Uncharacterized protein n=1 Tax=Pithovirus LCPAC404 TaxID=2506597 RepID=A0A481ZCP7_9VIRU|nr:MAG: hypothetical protein LCPAC404_03820 [Pithovirus LCPAC404]
MLSTSNSKRRLFSSTSSTSRNKRKHVFTSSTSRNKKRKKYLLRIPSEIISLIVSYCSYNTIIKAELDIPRISHRSYLYLGAGAIKIFRYKYDVHGRIPLPLFEQTVWEYRIKNLSTELGTVLYCMKSLETKYDHTIKRNIRNGTMKSIFNYFASSHPVCELGFIHIIIGEPLEANEIGYINDHWRCTWRGKIVSVLKKHEGKDIVRKGSGLVAAKMIIGVRDSDKFLTSVRDEAGKMYLECMEDKWFKNAVESI